MEQAQEVNKDAEQLTINEEQKPTKDPNYIICPCCGKPTLIRPVKIKDELLDHYMSCIISGTPFHRTYKLYNGKLKITVTQLNQETIEQLQQVARILSDWETQLQDRADLCKELNSVIRIYCCIPSIVIKTDAQETELQPAAVVSGVCATVIEKDKAISLTDTKPTYSEMVAFVSEQLAKVRSDKTAASLPMPILMGTIESHNQIYNILLGSGFDVNFWEGIELA